MKRILQIFFLSLITSVASLAQPLTNGSFENWGDTTLWLSVDAPFDITTTNIASWVTSGVPNTFPVDAGAPYDTVLHIETSADSIVGVFVTGVIEGDLDNPTFSGGFQINTSVSPANAPDSLILTLRYGTTVNDSLRILFASKGFGIPSSFNEVKLSGDSGWHRLAIAVEYLSTNPFLQMGDSMIVAVASEADENPSDPGNWMEIASLEVRRRDGTMATYPWGDFEDWKGETYTQPDGWLGSNVITVTPSVIENTVDVTDGTSSLEIVTTQSLDPTDDPLGFAILGYYNASLTKIYSGMAVAEVPVSLEFDYQYTPVGNDTGYVEIVGSFWSGGMTNLTSYGVMKLEPTLPSQFSSVSVPILSVGGPDSIYVVFYSSMPKGEQPQSEPGEGSTLIVDNGSITYDDVTAVSLGEVATTGVYPNPTKGELQIADQNADRIVVRDITGQIVREKSNDAQLNLDLESGMYMYELLDASNVQIGTGKLVIE